MNIKSVARLSGLTEHTLRAWEKRYGVVQPVRSEGGQRLYSVADVEKLKVLALLVDRGHSIGTIANLSQEDLSRLSKQVLETPRFSADHSLPPTISPHSANGAHKDILLATLRLLDFDELDRQILKARVDTPARVFVLDVVSPLLSEVGSLVAQDKLDVAQEHALSAILRNHLGDLLGQVQKASPWTSAKQNDLPCFLFATAEGDLHEFGILLAAILTGSKGLSFRYLGANMPPESLAKAAISIGAKIVVLGSVEAAAERLIHPMKQYIEILSTRFRKSGSPDIAIWLGGYCDFKADPKNLPLGFQHVASLIEYDRKLESLLNQSRRI